MTPEENYWGTRTHIEMTKIGIEQNTAEIENQFAIMRQSGARLFKDGNQWCCLYGANVQEGIVGFGATPVKALLDFNNAWNK